jgi:TonB family protein
MHSKIIVALHIVVFVSGMSHAIAQEPSHEGTQDHPVPETVFKIGKGVSPPRLIHHREPDFSEEARAAHYQGTCVLWLVVGEDGKPRNIRVTSSLGKGLDEKAIEAVSDWRFEPARKDGEPVAVEIAVEVDFRLYGKGDVKIAELTRKAAEGDAKAELELATAYFKGVDVGKNDALGLVFLEKAARRGLAKAQFLMGERIAHENASDYPKAYMWYTLAQRGGYKHNEKALEELSAKMTQEQILAGQTLVNNWTNAPAK